tara:strand:+ start:2210 stop:2407 length:198 start_codon:yes stop_codon:yes gene_type:complete
MDLNNTTVKYYKDPVTNENLSIEVIYPKDSNNSIRKICVPIDQTNTEYQAILAWVAEGNTIQEAD